jgi:TonB family protein
MASTTRVRADKDDMEEHFVEVNFTVTRDGRTADVVTSQSDATEAQQKVVLSAIRKARYAPRFEKGEPVDTPDVKFRERLLSKRVRGSAG